MDRNFVLALALSFLVLSLWTIYTAPPPPEPGAPVPSAATGEAPADAFAAAPPGGTSPAPEPAPGGRPGSPAPPAAEPPTPEELIRIETPLYEAVFTNRGGALLQWRLSGYDDASQPGRPAVEITTLDPTQDLALATPFESIGFGDLSSVTYQVERPGPRSLVFTHEQSGITLRKTYRLREDEYLFDLTLEVVNGADRHLRPTFLTLWPARAREGVDFREHTLAVLADGDLEEEPVAGGGSFLGMGGGIEAPSETLRDVDWVGANTRYFLAALMPDVPRDAAARFAPGRERGLVLAELAFQPVNLPPGQRVERSLRVYLGPKETHRLEAAGSHLDEAIYKGWLPALTGFFVWLLEATHGFVGNYGVAIILITLMVRVLMFPIMQKQVKSMKRMGEMQPRMKEIQEKYADDKQKQSEEMMKMWKESGFNPMAGCLPMFLQLPVFIGLFYALQGAIELRQAPFFGWITDLSAPEALFVLPGLEIPVRVLPTLMGASMLVQQRLTPTTMDPAQARMMNTVMPVMFTVLFYQFASGLVLYWFVSNVLGIAQQLWTNRKGPEPGKTPTATASKTNGKAGRKAATA